MNKRINTMYFSGTDTTKKVVCGMAKTLSENFQVKEKLNNVDFTLPKVREKVVSFFRRGYSYSRSSCLRRKSS